MANQKHLDELKKGSENWNHWRAAHCNKVPNLRFASLFSLNLPGVDFSGADLYGANLSRANLDQANLYRADLTAANLTDANLRSANLGRANLSGANLSGANFSDATVGWTIFSDVDLSQVKHLGMVRHYGPSSIGVETLYRSGSNLPPRNFLIGCGLSENFIAHIPTYINEQSAIQFYSCFISYSQKDEEFVKYLYLRLHDADIRVWFSSKDMRPGSKLIEQIYEAIRVHDKLLLVLSQHSLNSEWVKTEIRKARQDELNTGRRKLFPVRLVDWETVQKWEYFDAEIGQDLAVEVRQYPIPDFSLWEDKASFEEEFERLLEALTPETSTDD